MRRYHSAMAAMLLAGMGAIAGPSDDAPETKRRTSPPKPAPTPAPESNLPGETNRQFAARMQAAVSTASQPGTEAREAGRSAPTTPPVKTGDG